MYSRRLVSAAGHMVLACLTSDRTLTLNYRVFEVAAGAVALGQG